MIVGIIIIAVAAVAIGILAWKLHKREKASEKEEVINKLSEPTPVEVPKEEEKEPEKPKEEEVKPKFKVGDWVIVSTSDGEKVMQIDSIEFLKGGEPTYITSEGKWFDSETKAHLWTIQDAKDGDVLVSELIRTIMLYKGIENNNVQFYCDYDFSDIDVQGDRFAINNGQHYGSIDDSDDWHPATKEQHDLLFKKIKEAGYEWNPDTKELKEIAKPQEPTPTEEPKEEQKEEEPKEDPVLQEPAPIIKETPQKKLDECINAFKDYISIPKDGVTYNYLKALYEEASAQVASYTNNGIPLLYLERNFPVVTNYYGDNGNQAANFNTLVGWLFALQLSELKPKKRNHLFKVGYELGGCTYDSPVFGYRFETDPNVARLVASIIYVTMRAIKKPNIATMRAEVEGTSYPYGLSYYLDMGLNHLKTPEEIQKNIINKGGFYVDLREFMPSSAGPYAPGYTNRPPHVMTDSKDDYSNTKTDRTIHEHIVETFNLNNSDEVIKQMTVQAIADKEQSANHLYGDNKTVKEFSFHPVFGVDTINKKIKTDGAVANLTFSIQAISTYFRIILQSKAVNPVQYGRLRPGCSWEQEKKKNSDTDDRRNVLTNIVIEDNDGQKTSSYGYNEDGIWVATPVERSEYEEHQKNNLGANSYPSGHSSGIWTVAMMLCEAMPYKADLIMQAANQFAINRTISRYHWTSDTINGRVLGSIASAMCHATNDYDTLLKIAKNEI